MPRIKMIGDRYGKLVVKKEIEKISKERRFLCKCDCGNYTKVVMVSLRTGNTTSCGCYRDRRASETQRTDHTGKRYGKLVALKRVGRTEKRGKTTTPLWLCKCDCGNETVVMSNNLLSGHTKSCGCGSKNKPVDVTRQDIIKRINIIHNKQQKRPTYKELAKHFNCSVATISRRLKTTTIIKIWSDLDEND